MTTTKKSTKKKVEEPIIETSDVKVETKEVESDKYLEMLKEIEKLREQVAKQQQSPQVIIQKEQKAGTSKIKCINLMHGSVNISTQPFGQGRVYNFAKYGDVRLIKQDDLFDIIANYPNTFESGLIFIANVDFVESCGLTDEYDSIYKKDLIDEIKLLDKDEDVDLFVGMKAILQESTSMAMAEMMAEGYSYDLNRLQTICDRTKIDIRALSTEILNSKKK